jgi:hypothetical protein
MCRPTDPFDQYSSSSLKRSINSSTTSSAGLKRDQESIRRNKEWSCRNQQDNEKPGRGVSRPKEDALDGVTSFGSISSP